MHILLREKEGKKMETAYFSLPDFINSTGPARPILEVAEEVFLLDLKKGTIWLSQKIADVISGWGNPLPPVISMEQFENFFPESSCNSWREEIQRIVAGKAVHCSCHMALQRRGSVLSSVMYMCKIGEGPQIVGFLSVDYDSAKEYDQQLQEVIKKLQHAQMINELTLDGASDYIYQLDIVNNVCTFSPKAIDVLPLDCPTFPDAFNRVMSFIIPEDRQVFLDSFTPFLTGQSDRHVAEYRVRTKHGDLMWISCQGKGIHDEEGRPLMIAGSLMDITDRKKHEEEIHRMLYFDMLTGLKNRRSFERDMAQQLAQPDARGSLLYMDIRKFKLYNELFGHDFGNLVLKEFAKILRLFFPAAQGIYRISGDEFLVHLREFNRTEILNKLTPFRTCLKMTREIEEHTLYINANVAITIYPEHGSTPEELLRNANKCLYRMNREEREEVCFFAGETSNSISWQFLLENELRKDIEQGFRHFRVVYQPIVEIGSAGARWIGAEALLRYSNPDFSNLDQTDLIRTLEYSGLIQNVGRWVIGQAVRECSRWNQGGQSAIVHVNVAAQQVTDARLVSYIEDCCREVGLPPTQLVLELTETSLVDNFGIASNFCESLMRLGCGIALDDFGSGYSGFNYLRSLPLSEIKVDRIYAHMITQDPYNQIIVSFLHELSKSLNLKLCVEGVETEQELSVIRNMDVNLIQGFYFSAPLESDVMLREFPSKSMYF